MLSDSEGSTSSRYATLALIQACRNIAHPTNLYIIDPDSSIDALYPSYVTILYNVSLSLILVMLDAG